MIVTRGIGRKGTQKVSYAAWGFGALTGGAITIAPVTIIVVS